LWNHYSFIIYVAKYIFMKLVLTAILLLGLTACNYTVNHYSGETPTSVDTITLKDTVRLTIRDTIFIPKEEVKKTPPTEKQIKQPSVDTTKPKSKPGEVKQAQSDTVIHYYDGNKAVSVKVTPEVNGEKFYLLFDPFGKETYRMESVRKSYSSSVRLRFRPNGSVEKADIHFNPGASLHWYETYITFSINNEPQWKVSQQMPMRSAADFPQKEYWDKQTAQWRKQEIME
jgi:hypothetical protein